MAKSPKHQRSAQSTTKQDAKNKGKSALPVKTCCPDCAGKPSGTMGACEDDTCRDIPPPQGIGPWVLYWNAELNEGFPYWESIMNIGEGLRGKLPHAVPSGEPEEPTPPHQTVK